MKLVFNNLKLVLKKFLISPRKFGNFVNSDEKLGKHVCAEVEWVAYAL